MHFSIKDAFADDLSLEQFQMSLGESKRFQRVQKFIAGLSQRSQKTCKSPSSLSEIKQLIKRMNLKVPDFGHFLFTLNHHSYLKMSTSYLPSMDDRRGLPSTDEREWILSSHLSFS